MPILSFFSGSYCNDAAVIERLRIKRPYALITDAEVVESAAAVSGMSASKISKVFSAKGSVFDQFTHDRERAVAALKHGLAAILAERRDDLFVAGFSALLAPRTVTHILRICLISDMKYRIAQARKENMTDDQARKAILKSDEDRMKWTAALLNQKDPWDASLYDMVLPSDKMPEDEIVHLIEKMLTRQILQHNTDSDIAIDDFLLASRVEGALAAEGHFVDVESRSGEVLLTINRHVLMLSRLKDELQAIAEKVSGVRAVSTKVGKGFYQANIVRNQDFEAPPKVLLVDDEREFVQTLSERLQMRDVTSAMVFDGTQALDVVRDEEPDVMILDLKMPGIDGIEVLRRVKESNPLVEVIILTGHGSEEDRDTCMQLGAFAYLQKPVDIALLSETIRLANQKIREHRQD